MSHHIDAAMHSIGRMWRSATPEDFGAMALAIVCTAWFFSRFYGNR